MRLIHILTVPVLALILSARPAGQSRIHKGDDTLHHLYTAGVGGALIGGLYDGIYPYGTLKQHGNFGLGAPALLDGELIIFNGKIYQTQHTGKTVEVNDKQLASFAMVNYFHPSIKITPDKPMNKAALFHLLDSVLTNVNGMYAIHINGTFSMLKTRAFPPVKEHQHTPLADMLSLQHFFTYNSAQGDLVGYRLPVFMDNTNISGYHFHFLSAQKNEGGHMIDLLTDHIQIEIDVLDSYSVQVPATSDYEHFDFKKNREEDIKSVERGGKAQAQTQGSATPQTDTMTLYRDKIDQLDKQIVQLLGERMEAARAIGTYKMAHKIGVVQSNRFNEVLQRAIAEGKQLQLSEEFIKKLYEDVHAESVRQQEALKK